MISITPAALPSPLFHAADKHDHDRKLALMPTKAASHGYEELNPILRVFDAIETRRDAGVHAVGTRSKEKPQEE
ncbi:hypothetical protein PYCCODRAFT_1470252 [Trametes coccinea BRFM310]|uniref:Uncharacterized protein n=1 Tax=Trametes coccinea (strain BRFM310) TaxID=1353009 RepID=A0A1Y2IE18_TRAC3|nr:hypothetical protein PYCCODRAFT_1470252 [Trametes coccinea BRFM310]